MSSSKKDKEIFERMANATALLTKAGPAMIEDAKNNPCPDGPLAGKFKPSIEGLYVGKHKTE